MKFKVGDTVRRIDNDNGSSFMVGDISIVECIRNESGVIVNGEYNFNEYLELVKKGKKVKKEKKSYIVVKGEFLLDDALMTKDEAISRVPSDSYSIIDISDCPRYKVVTKKRLVKESK